MINDLVTAKNDSSCVGCRFNCGFSAATACDCKSEEWKYLVTFW